VTTKTSRKVGLAWPGVVGQCGAGVMYIVISEVARLELVWPFAALMLFLQGFTMVAGVLVTPTIVELVPRASRDMWIGYQAGYSQLTNALCPLILMPLLSGEVDGTVGFGVYLKANGFTALGSALLYVVLTRRFPVPREKVAMSDEDKARIQRFEETGDASKLPFELLSAVIRVRLKEGKPLPHVKFGKFVGDADKLWRAKAAARRDFEHFRSVTTRNIAAWQKEGESRERTRAAVDNLVANAAVWPEDTKEDFGRWVSDYMEFAGYSRPDITTNLMKGILITAFPPLHDDLSKGWGEFKEDPVPHWTKMHKFLASFIALDKDGEREQRVLANLRGHFFNVAGAH